MVRSRRSTLTRVVLVAGSVAASLGPAPRFSACESHLRPLVDVLVFVELELERYLRATHTKEVDEHYCSLWESNSRIQRAGEGAQEEQYHHTLRMTPPVPMNQIPLLQPCATRGGSAIKRRIP